MLLLSSFSFPFYALLIYYIPISHFLPFHHLRLTVFFSFLSPITFPAISFPFIFVRVFSFPSFPSSALQPSFPLHLILEIFFPFRPFLQRVLRRRWPSGQRSGGGEYGVYELPSSNPTKRLGFFSAIVE